MKLEPFFFVKETLSIYLISLMPFTNNVIFIEYIMEYTTKSGRCDLYSQISIYEQLKLLISDPV